MAVTDPTAGSQNPYRRSKTSPIYPQVLPSNEQQKAGTSSGQGVYVKQILVNNTPQFVPLMKVLKPTSKPAELVSVELEQSYAYAPKETAETPHLSFTFIFPDKKRYCITRPGKVMKNFDDFEFSISSF